MMALKPSRSLAAADRATIRSIANRNKDTKGAAIIVLQAVQDSLGYVSKEVIAAISEATGIPASDLYSIVTFYSQFRLQPLGEHVLKVCHGTACHLAGAEQVTHAIEMVTGAKEGTTSADGKFTHERVACLGCCSLAPVVMVDGDIKARLQSDKIKRMIDDIVKRSETKAQKPSDLTQSARGDQTDDRSR